MGKRSFLRWGRDVGENFLRFGRNGGGVPSIGYRFGKRDDSYDDMHFLRFGRARLERRKRSAGIENEVAQVKEAMEAKRNGDDQGMKFLRFGKSETEKRRPRDDVFLRFGKAGEE